jgi:hypothetical protein
MHYKNGREAKAGDKVVNLPTGRSGVLHTVSAQFDTCNGCLAKISDSDPYVTIKECLHIDDIARAEAPDSSKA